MQLFLQLPKLQGTTSYFDENVGRVGVKSDTVNHVNQIHTNQIIDTNYRSCSSYGNSALFLKRSQYTSLHFYVLKKSQKAKCGS